MISNFESFNESKRVGGDYANLAEIARTVISKLFGQYEKGLYEEDSYHHYGDKITWSNGVEETGYITDIYRIKIKKEWLMMKFLSKEHLKKYFAIIDRTLPHADNALDWASIVVTSAYGISSRRKELLSIRIWAGEEKFAQAYADVDISKGFNNARLREIEKSFKESAAEISEENLIKSIFEDIIQTIKMIKKYKNNPNYLDLRKFNKHFGIAWQNSSKLNKLNDLTGIFKNDDKDEKDYLTLRFEEMKEDDKGFTFFKYFQNYKDGVIYTTWR